MEELDAMDLPIARTPRRKDLMITSKLPVGASKASVCKTIQGVMNPSEIN